VPSRAGFRKAGASQIEVTKMSPNKPAEPRGSESLPPTISGRRDPTRCHGPDEIWQGDTLLGTFHVEEGDMFWSFGRFVPTAAFEGLRPTFDAFNRCAAAPPETPAREGLWAAWRAIRLLNLRFEGRSTDWFAEPIVLIVERGGRARFTPVSRPKPDQAASGTAPPWWRQAAGRVCGLLSRGTTR
jgi:hypothetical protein